ncbi:mCG1048776 [Mus musculus]|nr:mCG1048776 [Mus musculus]
MLIKQSTRVLAGHTILHNEIMFLPLADVQSSAADMLQLQ